MASRLQTRQPQLPHSRHRLHWRPAPLSLHGGKTRCTLQGAGAGAGEAQAFELGFVDKHQAKRTRPLLGIDKRVAL